MLTFNWNSVDDSTFQGYLNKYTNAFKGFQTRYFVLDIQTKSLLYFMPDDIKKHCPRGVIELTDCWISPSDEDDLTFTVKTGNGDIFKFRASDTKDRQRWIDKLRVCSGSNAADVFVSSLSSTKVNSVNTTSASSNEQQVHLSDRRNSRIRHHQKTLKEMREVIRCVEENQRDFADTIDSLPESNHLHPLSKDMLLLRSLSHSIIISLQDSLTILTKRRTPDIEVAPTITPPTSSTQTSVSTVTPMSNLCGKQLSQSYNNGSNIKSKVTVSHSTNSNSCTNLSRITNLNGLS